MNLTELNGLARLLFEHGAAIETTNLKGYTALHLAVRDQKDKAVRLFVAKGANVEAERKNGKKRALYLASISGNEKIIKILLQEKAKLEVRDESRYTALHLAAQQQ